MSRSQLVFTLAAPIACLLETGCSKDSCVVDKTGVECSTVTDMSTPAAFSVTPTRLPLNMGTMTSIKIQADAALSSKSVTLQQMGVTIPLPLGTLDKTGALAATVSAMSLSSAGFKPGLPTAVAISGKTETVPVRIFLSPKFDNNTLSGSSNIQAEKGTANSNSPVWISVLSDKKILTLNYYKLSTVDQQSIGEYIFDNLAKTNKTINQSKSAVFGSYSGSPYMDQLPHGIATTASNLLIAGPVGSSSILKKCTFSGTCGDTVNSYKSISSLAASPTGQLFAGIFVDTTSKILAFSDPDLTTSISFTGNAADASAPYLVVVSDLNGDQNPDVAIWHTANGNISVALYNATQKTLAYNAAYSAALQNELRKGIATGLPDAVTSGDLDADGLDDIIAVSGSSIYVIVNRGDGTFAADYTITIPSNVSLAKIASLGVGKASPDGKGDIKDIVLASKDNQRIAIMENSATY